jgi:hypothetical protein
LVAANPRCEDLLYIFLWDHESMRHTNKRVNQLGLLTQLHTVKLYNISLLVSSSVLHAEVMVYVLFR